MENIKSERLQAIIKKDKDGKIDNEALKQAFIEYKDGESSQNYKLEVMMAFWYAIHTENLEQAQIIYSLDPIIEKIMKSIREKGEKDLQIKKYREEEKKKK